MKKSCLLVVVLAIMTSSCGFEPLYVQKTSKEDKWYFDGNFDNYVADQMAQIKIVVD